MRFKLTGPKQDYGVANIINNDTVTIKQGGPVFLDPTQDGVKVLSAESLAEAKQSFFFGLAITDIVAGDHGESIVFGFFTTARILLRSRAASTDSWPAIDETPAGVALQFMSNTGLQALFPDAPAQMAQEIPLLALCQSFASVASVASATSNTSIYSTGTYKVQVRAL